MRERKRERERGRRERERGGGGGEKWLLDTCVLRRGGRERFVNGEERDREEESKVVCGDQ